MGCTNFAISDCKFDVIGNLILNWKVELELAICTSCAINLQMAAGAYCVVTVSAQLTHDLLTIAKFLVVALMT